MTAEYTDARKTLFDRLGLATQQHINANPQGEIARQFELAVMRRVSRTITEGMVE